MDDFNWTTEAEIKFFRMMTTYKTAGVSKHFVMAYIIEQLAADNINVSGPAAWAHFRRLYNEEAIDEIENDNFLNEIVDFDLPDDEFGELKIKKGEKPEDMPGKAKKFDSKDLTKTLTTKEDKITGKKETPRRDSKDGKDAKLTVTFKKEVNKEVSEKVKPLKSRNSGNTKEEDKAKSPSKTDDAHKRSNKRPTRLSAKPEEPGTSGTKKSKSPVTDSSPNLPKRRR